MKLLKNKCKKMEKIILATSYNNILLSAKKVAL